MNNTMVYNGYIGSVEFNEEEMIFFGKLLGIKSVIMYEGKNAKELVADFHGAVDEYLADCKEKNILPETPYKGNINIRLKPTTHQRVAIYSLNHDISINNFVEESVEYYLTRKKA